MSTVTKTVIVKGQPSDVFSHWADFENFPKFMTYIKKVESTGDDTSHWVMSGPAGRDVDWNAEVTRMEENKRIAWSTKDNEGSITTSGQALFTGLPNDQTQVTVTMHYTMPGGKAAEALAKLFTNPEKRLETDLRNFKQMVEKETIA